MFLIRKVKKGKKFMLLSFKKKSLREVKGSFIKMIRQGFFYAIVAVAVYV